jgi:SH3-like domain-containing protein
MQFFGSTSRSVVAAFAAATSLLGVNAEEFKQTTGAATVGYEGPSTRSEKQFIYSRGTPLEVLVSIEGWFKVRDVQGTLVWVERRALGDRANVQVKSSAPTDVYANPDATSPVAFRVEPGVVLSLVALPTPATGPFAQVRHRDGQIGFARVDSLFGL